MMKGSSDGLRILVVDDEPQIRRLLVVALGSYGYTVLEADCGRAALAACEVDHPDAVILDLGLPDIDGQEVIRRLREWSPVPIVVLSVRQHEREKVAALDSGANDFVNKPFSVPELCARLRAAMRSLPADARPVLELGDSVRVDRLARRVFKAGAEVHLTPTEYNLLLTIAEHPGRVVTHKHLLRTVWGLGCERHTEYLRVYIAQLRRKLEDSLEEPQLIVTEPGVGYRTCGGPIATLDAR